MLVKLLLLSEVGLRSGKENRLAVQRSRLCAIALLLFALSGSSAIFAAETSNPKQTPVSESAVAFRLETLPIGNGAELLTVFGKLRFCGAPDGCEEEIPLVSVLRDTLGDARSDNDQLRYVWALTYTRPDFKKQAAASIPFFYARLSNQTSASSVPPPLLDMTAGTKGIWYKAIRMALQRAFLDSGNRYLRASSRTYLRNRDEYRKVHVLRALAILSLFDDESAAGQGFTSSESNRIQARLLLAEKTLGGLVEDKYLESVYRKQMTKMRDARGHNWELLRQRAESEGLYFEPLEMPDGSATHALLWVSRADLQRQSDRKFNGRFLNIANPWDDRRLRDWQGYSESRYFDAEHRPVAEAVAGGHAEELIPLALYGLDYPKIPILLVDFRDRLNAKKREASKRLLDDLARNLFAISKFSDFRYFLARAAFNFVTARRGSDINQPSRMRTYSQLQLLLSLSNTMDTQLKDEVQARLQQVSLNPMENDPRAEIRIARDQYAALKEYAIRPDGLAAQLDRDRQAELLRASHNGFKRTLFSLGRVFSLGIYQHREADTSDQLARLSQTRALAFHQQLLESAIKAGTPLEVAWDVNTVRRSLEFIAENSSLADAKIVRLAEQAFARSADEETRHLSLLCLYRINREPAKAALLKIYKSEAVDSKWRAQSAAYLRLAMSENQRIAPAVVKEVVGMGL